MVERRQLKCPVGKPGYRANRSPRTLDSSTAGFPVSASAPAHAHAVELLHGSAPTRWRSYAVALRPRGLWAFSNRLAAPVLQLPPSRTARPNRRSQSDDPRRRRAPAIGVRARSETHRAETLTQSAANTATAPTGTRTSLFRGLVPPFPHQLTRTLTEREQTHVGPSTAGSPLGSTSTAALPRPPSSVRCPALLLRHPMSAPLPRRIPRPDAHRSRQAAPVRSCSTTRLTSSACPSGSTADQTCATRPCGSIRYDCLRMPILFTPPDSFSP